MARVQLVVASLVVVLLVAGSAAAQDASATAGARTAFEEGTRRLDANDFDGAVAAFERSLTLRESPAARFNLALAYRGRGQLARAATTLRAVLANPGDAARSMQDEATRLLAEIEQSLAHATLRVVGTPVELTVDGEAVPPRALQSLDLDPGHHVFEGRSQDRAPVRLERDLARSSTTMVTLDLATAEQAPARLDVHVSQGEAHVYVNDDEVGRGHYDGYVPPGHATLRVSADGYATRTLSLDLRAGEHRELDVSLVRGAGGSVLEEWWFWTIIGVVVAGAALAIGVAAANPTTNVGGIVEGTDGGHTVTLLAM